MAVNTYGTAVNPAHYVEIPGSTNPPQRPLSGGTLKVRDHITQAPLPDSTYAVTTGYFGFTSTSASVDVSADNGATWVPLISFEAELAGSSAGAAATAAQTAAGLAQTAATAAAASAAGAAAAAAASVQQSTVGVANGVGSLGTDGRQPPSQVAQIVLDQLDAVNGQLGAISASTEDHFLWNLNVAAIGPLSASLVAGKQSSFWRLPNYPCLLPSGGIITELDDFSASSGTYYDVLYSTDLGVTWTSLYNPGGPYPGCDVNNNVQVGLDPVTNALPARALLAIKPVTVAPAGTSSGTAAALKGTPVPYASTTTAPSTHTLTIPSGGAAGDMVVLDFHTPGATATMPAPWTKVIDQVSDPSPACRSAIFVAPWSSGLTAVVTVSTGSPGAGGTQLVSGADPTTVVAQGTQGGFHVGVIDTIPATTAPIAADVLYVTSSTFWPSGVTGYTDTWAGGPAGFAKIASSDSATGRSAASNVTRSVAKTSTALTVGATVAAMTATQGGGTGSTGNMSHAGVQLYIPRAAGTHGPSALKAQIDVVAA